jgi:hypothetical protein
MMLDDLTALEPSEFYLDSIGAPGAVRMRIRDLLDRYARLMDLSDVDIFASESIDSEGNRTFQSLWIFSEQGGFEGRLSEESGTDLDGTPLRDRVVHWVARVQDYDFRVALPTSRLTLEISFSDQIIGELRASGPNCMRLTELIRKYVIPNMR